MGGLKPIGSEKLQGMDKIRRIMEIARFNEVLPQSINEDKSTEYTLPLADGNTYAIVKERQGYIIKLSLNESVSDYIEPMQNRKYFSSYSQALKKLNLMAKEYNGLYGNDEGTSLFSEQKKKFKLRLPKTNTEETPAPAPAPELAPAPAPVTPPAPAGDMGGELPPPAPAGDMGGDDFLPADASSETPPAPEGMGDDMGGDMPPPPEGMDDDMGDDIPPLPDDMEDDDMGDEPKKEEGTSFKIIQKLTGKLAQKIRKYNDKDEMDGNDVKYIINSILSALDVDVLDDDDLEEIISRLEGDYDEEDKDEEDEDNEDEDTSLEEPSDMGDEDLPPPPPEGGEMSEYNTPTLGDAVNRLATTTMADGLSKMSGEMGEEYPKHGARSGQRSYNHLEHGTFGESKVDKIISKYFNITDEDVMINESKEIKKREELENLREKNVRGIKRLSENIRQERMALKFIEINPTSKLAGLSNKGNLVFVDGLTERKVTINGKVL